MNAIEKRVPELVATGVLAFSSGTLENFHCQSDPLTATDAQRDDAAFKAVTLDVESFL